MESLQNNGVPYIIVGILTCATTIAVTLLNKRFGKRIKPDHSSQAGYTEWVAYLEKEIQAVRDENKNLNKRIGALERRLHEKDTLIGRMRSRLLELSRKYDEDVSSVI